MVLSSLRLFILVVAGTILVVAAAPAKDGFPCKTDADCAKPLSCLGKPESLRCKMKKPVGGQCGDPTWVCQEGLDCKIETGERYGNCVDTPKDDDDDEDDEDPKEEPEDCYN